MNNIIIQNVTGSQQQIRRNEPFNIRKLGILKYNIALSNFKHWTVRPDR